jgi:two-component system, LuxR family, sensor kinase FixL
MHLEAPATALRRSAAPPDARATRLLDAFDQAAGLLDECGQVSLANPALGALLGVSAQQLLGQPWRERLCDEALAAWDRAFADAGAGSVGSCAGTLRHADGRSVPVEMTLRALAGVDGRIDAYALGVSQPMRQRDADEMLRWIARATAPLTGDDFFRTLMRNLAEAFGFRRAFIAECVDRPTTRVRTLAYWSDAEFRPNYEFDLAGTPCEMTIRDGKVYCVSEGLAQQYGWAHRQRLDSYLGAPIFDTRGEHLIGHVAFETSGRMDRSILDNPLFQIFVSRASAELRRKRAEDVLRASEENYRLLVEHQSDVLVKYDGRQRLLFVSPSFCRLFGVSEQALLGCSFRPPVADEDRTRFQLAWDALGSPPHESRFEERVSTTQGWRCIAWSQKAMLDADGDIVGVVAAGRDVTERQRAEEQARAHLQQLAHVGRLSAMGEMGTAIAHEINQPLTALRTYAQASQRLLASGSEPQALTDTLARIALLAERASEIVRRLRGFLAKEPMRTMPVEPNYIVSEVVGLARAEAAQGGVRLTIQLAEGLPRVDVDCIQIEQVLLNLVRNGIEAVAQADTEQRLLRIGTRRVGDEVWLSVHDSGPGVPAASAESIFEAFVTTKPGGMGIGLAISRSIAEVHGGRLWLDMTAGEGGALFHLALPALAAEAEE